MWYLFTLCVCCIIIELTHVYCYDSIRVLSYKNRVISKIATALTKITLDSLKLDIVLLDYSKEEDPYIRDTSGMLLQDALAINRIVKSMPPFKTVESQLMNAVFSKTDKQRLGLHYFVEVCYIIAIFGIFRELMLMGQSTVAWWFLAMILLILPVINAFNHLGPKDKIKWWYKADAIISMVIYLRLIFDYVSF